MPNRCSLPRRRFGSLSFFNLYEIATSRCVIPHSAGLHDISFEVESTHRPVRVLEHEKPELTESGRSSRYGPSHVGPSKFTARLKACNFTLCLGIFLGRVQHSDRAHLGG